MGVVTRINSSQGAASAGIGIALGIHLAARSPNRDSQGEKLNLRASTQRGEERINSPTSLGE